MPVPESSCMIAGLHEAVLCLQALLHQHASQYSRQYATLIPALAKLILDGIAKPAQRTDGVLALLAAAVLAAADQKSDGLLSEQVSEAGLAQLLHHARFSS